MLNFIKKYIYIIKIPQYVKKKKKKKIKKPKI